MVAGFVVSLNSLDQLFSSSLFRRRLPKCLSNLASIHSAAVALDRVFEGRFV